MELIVRGRIIQGSIVTILQQIRYDSGNDKLFSVINELHTDVQTICPYHKYGMERKPSATLYKLHDSSSTMFGYFHCFACNTVASLPKLVADCFGTDITFANDWLYENFGTDSADLIMGDNIDVADTSIKKVSILDEKILDRFNVHHEYMDKRGLKGDVIERFRIGYDELNNAITFPVWDEYNRLRFITERSVNTKKFWIPKNANKGDILYLLNFAIKDKVPMVMITEAQIDALTAWGYGMPCCATFGGVTKPQVDVLRKSGIRTIITAFDNDEAGKKFTKLFNSLIPRDFFVYNFVFPNNKKDINDLTYEEFVDGLQKIGINFPF